MNFDAIKDLLYRMADDDLLIGHRMSEWTGIGPILEEDIAFSSIAQDEIGHAQAYYQMMHEFMGEAHPDQVAFNRKPAEFRSSQLVEYPIGDYAFSLMRHALYDVAESIRLEALVQSSFRPLSELAKKLLREEKYHLLHAHTWLKQLGPATEESNRRMQAALNELYPIAFSLFEPSSFDAELAEMGVCPSESDLEARWVDAVTNLCLQSGLQMPQVADKTAHYGGRKGVHTTHLDKLMAEMTEVFVIDTTAVW